MKLPNHIETLAYNNSRAELGLITPSRKLKALEFFYNNFHLVHFYCLLTCIGILVINQIFNVRLFLLQDVASGILTFWMPGYCIVFHLWDSKRFTPILLLPLGLLFSQVVIIIEGLIWSSIGILWTPLSILVALGGFCCVSFLYFCSKNGNHIPREIRLQSCSDFPAFKAAFQDGHIIPRNFLFLLVFLVLLGIFSVVCFPTLQDDDSWYHARILTIILDTGHIPYSDFRGCLGFHIFASAFGSLSGLGSYAVAQWFPIYLVVNAGLAFYPICYRLFKNHQVAILGSLLVSFNPVGYLFGTNFFWPNAIALPFGLYFFFFLADINLTGKTSLPQKYSNIVLILLLSVVFIFLEDVIFIYFWLAAFFVQILYRKNAKSQIFNLAIMGIALSFFLLFSVFFYQSYIFSIPKLIFDWPFAPWIYLALIPVVYLGYRIVKSMVDFPPRSFQSLLTNANTNSWFTRRWENKISYIVLLIIPLATSLFYFVIFTFFSSLLSISIIGIMIAIALVLQIFGAIQGLAIIRRKKKSGEFLFFWGTFTLLSAGAYTLYDFYTGLFLWWRLFVFASPGFVLLIVAYLYRIFFSSMISSRRITHTIRYYAIGILFIALITDPIAYASLPNYGVSAAAMLGKYTPQDIELVTTMKWESVVNYYHGVPIVTNSQESYYLFDDSVNDQRNFFYSLRDNDANRTILAVLDSSDMTASVISNPNSQPNQLTPATLNGYQELTYLNHVLSSCGDPNAWVMIFALV